MIASDNLIYDSNAIANHLKTHDKNLDGKPFPNKYLTTCDQLTKIVEGLRSQRAKIKRENGKNIPYVFTPGSYANRLDNIREIIKSGSYENLRSYTDFDWSVERDLIDTILKKGSDEIIGYVLENMPIKNNENNHLIQYAAQEGLDRVLEFLLADSVDPNVSNKNGNAPIHFASSHNRVSSIKILLSKGASTPVYDVCKRGFNRNDTNASGCGCYSQ